jgi:hypothetical protein
MFANFVSKKDHGDRFLGQGGCAFGGFTQKNYNIFSFATYFQTQG